MRKLMLYRFPHPMHPTLLYVPLGVVLSILALAWHPLPPIQILLWLLAGIFAWTAVEYGLHRFVFHLTEIKEPWRSAASGLHMAHHHEPDIKTLIVAPPSMSLFFATLLFLAFWGISRDLSIATLMITGLFVGYCLYEWVHYGSHVYKMGAPWARALKKYHLQHHHKHPNAGFGVTTSVWDRVFGTYPPS